MYLSRCRGDLAQARIKVGYIVGRQTKDLDEAGMPGGLQKPWRKIS